MYKDIVQQAIEIALTRRLALREAAQSADKGPAIEELNEAYQQVVDASDPELAYQQFVATYGQDSWNRVVRNNVTTLRRKETKGQL